MLNINTVNFNVEYVTRRDEKSRHEIFSQMSVRAVLPFAYSEPSYFLSMFFMVLVNGIVNKSALKTPVASGRRQWQLRGKKVRQGLDLHISP
jgi:hypothetical protein